MDRTLQLPEDIIHHILSFLKAKEAAKTCVLSKMWLRAWSTCPNLDFGDEGHFLNLRFVDKTLLIYHKQGVPIHKFRLSMDILDDSDSSPLIDSWMGILLQKHVKEIDIKIRAPFGPRFILLQTPFVSTSLTTLRLHGFNLEKSYSSGDSIKLVSLQKLSFESGSAEENVIHNLLSGCPQLEELCIDGCLGLNKLKVVNLHKLKKVVVGLVKYVEIDAPSLQSFGYTILNSCMQEMFNVDSCQGLKVVRLTQLNFEDDFFHSFVSKLPLLEDLTLESCYYLERIKISSHRLKKFHLGQCENLAEAKIDAPNLFSFGYDCEIRQIPSLFLTCAPCQWKATIDCGNFSINSALFLKLRNFVTSLNHSGLLMLKLSYGAWPARRSITMNEEDLKDIPLPQVCEIEHLMLETDCMWEFPEPLLDGLFWSFHPKKLSVDSLYRYECKIDLISGLSQMLMDREGNPQCCGNNKCWRHYLRDVGIVSIEETKFEEEAFCHKENPFFYHGKKREWICFNLQWSPDPNGFSLGPC